MHSYMQSFLFVFSKLVYAKELCRLCPDLVVCPAGLPHAQSLCVGELPFEAEQDPPVAEEQLEAVLPESGQVLVEAGQHETQQLPQVHLRAGQRGYAPVLQTQFLVIFLVFLGWNYSSEGCMFVNIHRCHSDILVSVSFMLVESGGIIYTIYVIHVIYTSMCPLVNICI